MSCFTSLIDVGSDDDVSDCVMEDSIENMIVIINHGDQLPESANVKNIDDAEFTDNEYYPITGVEILHTLDDGSEYSLAENKILGCDGMSTRFTCEYCSKKMLSEGALIRHVRIHTKEKPYECNLCRKRFSVKCSLKNHYFIHTGEKPHECKVCKKRFIQISSLVTHMRTHTGEKPFMCDICHKSFSQGVSLRRHKMLHSGEKPIECSVCLKRFREKISLQKHMRRHTGEKPYSCDTCSKRFAHKCNLIKHASKCPSRQCKQSSEDRPFVCEECGMKFKRKDHLKRHELDSRCKSYKLEELTEEISGVIKTERPRRKLLHSKKNTENRKTNKIKIVAGRKRPYSCHGCDKTFSLASQLRSHSCELYSKPWK